MTESKYPYIPERLSYEKIAQIPVASPEMTVQERRQLCVDFFYFTNSFLWTPKENLDYVIKSSKAPRSLEVGRLYGGLCYDACSSGNVYRIMDYYDPETGILDLKTGYEKEYNFVTCQCSGGAHWSWARVQCPAWFRGCSDMVVKNGCRKIGPYQYDPELEEFSEEYGTGHVCQENGKQVMFESYAQMQLADCLVYFTTAGHVVMARSKPWVVRNEDGTIDGDASHIFIVDQAQAWHHNPTKYGEEFFHMPNIRREITFNTLFDSAYIPVTIAAFDEDFKCETPWLKINLSQPTVSVEDLKSAVVTSNYVISDLYVIVEDDNGAELYKEVTRTEGLFKMSWSAEKAVDAEKLQTLSGKQVKILCQSGSGIREVVYSGKLQ